MSTTLSLPLLQSVRIASPCPARWDQMTGDDAKRYCGECHLHVYNLSAMKAADAEALLANAAASGERLCGAFYRRADGTILTSDCPVGVSLARRAARRAGAIAIAALSMIFATGAWAVRRQYIRDNPEPVQTKGEMVFSPGTAAIELTAFEPMRTVARWLTPKRAPAMPMPGRMIMGDVALPTAPSAGAPGTGGVQ